MVNDPSDRRRARWFALSALLYATILPAQAPTVQAVRVTTAPRMDGRLTDAVWQTAQPVTGLLQREPDEGSPAMENTEVRFAYDDDALYVGARMFSRDPRAIRALVTRRDNETISEEIFVSLDTYRDRRTAYTFAVSTAGVRRDFYHASDEEDDQDDEWNPVWEATAHVDSVGWTAEMRIPFSQLRFTRAEVQEWGLNVARRVPDQNELSFWSLVRRTEPGWSSRMGTLTGIRGIRPSRRLEVLPYVAGSSRARADYDAADPFNKAYANAARTGGDLKMGLGPNLTFDLTVNPDFGQVEGDPAVVNLSAYETFFDERRPFFLEGSDLFDRHGLFYSRRIGAAPPGSASGDFVERLSNSTILGAGKLTGRLPSGLSIAALAAVSDEEKARTLDTAGTPVYGSTVVAPRTAYAVASARQEFGEDGSTVHATATAVRRDVTAGTPLGDLLARDAYSGFVDGRWRWADGEYDLNSYVGFTSVRGDSAAILRQQLSSRRYYQRPDANHVDVDPARRSLAGTLFGVGHSKMAGRHWLWDLDYQQLSPGWETNDAGRQGAVDYRRVFGRVRWRETKPSRWYRRWDTGMGFESEWNSQRPRPLRRVGEHFSFFSITLPNYWEVNVDLNYAVRGLSDRLTRGGPVMGTPANWGGSLELQSREDSRNSWALDLSAGKDETGAFETNVELNFEFRPGDRWEFSIDPEWSRGSDTRQYLDEVPNGRPETYFTRYVFGRVDLSEISARFRLNYTFTPNLTLETYAQPFAASGRFSRLGELARPRHRELNFYGTGGSTIVKNPDGSHTITADGQTFDIDNEDFNERSLRTNVVLRWEWRLGSTLYLVWQQNRAGDRAIATAKPGDLIDAFRTRGDNFLAIKASYWLALR